MTIEQLHKVLGNVDIYLLNQVMQQRYGQTDAILDAGCGVGRNFEFFKKLNFNIAACDVNPLPINDLKNKYPGVDIRCASLENLPYKNNSFKHVICNAVLHFAPSEDVFFSMLNELTRVTESQGTLFIRMASVFGIEQDLIKINNQYLLPDGTHRFLLNKSHLNYIKNNYDLLAPVKTVNVQNLRCMTTLVIKKR
jgi:ubiquinone/menaquinone biosynthesis C-methylase UbiE